jgi:two-component system sensor histidine kinase TctE
MPPEHWANAPVRYSRKSGVSPDSAGLGLVIVEAVARAHGGRLRFRIAPNGWFEAALVLPAGPGPDDRPAAL